MGMFKLKKVQEIKSTLSMFKKVAVMRLFLKAMDILPWWIQEKIMISQMEVILAIHGEKELKRLISMF